MPDYVSKFTGEEIDDKLTKADGYAKNIMDGTAPKSLHTTMTEATEEGAVALGVETSARGVGAVAFGNRAFANSEGCASFGVRSVTRGRGSFSAGVDCDATGVSSASLGSGARAYGDYSFAHGHRVFANAEGSHVEGFQTGTIKGDDYAHVEGKYNLPKEPPGTLAHVVGNGTSEDTRSNAYTLDWQGNGWFAGKVKIGGTSYDDPVSTELATLKELNDAIAGLGTVFNIKGSKPSKDQLPVDGNKPGDVWYVEDEEVGYIWIEKEGVLQWEPFGPTIDLSGYLQIANLAKVTGTSEVTAMTQKAVTDELNQRSKFTVIRRW